MGQFHQTNPFHSKVQWRHGPFPSGCATRSRFSAGVCSGLEAIRFVTGEIEVKDINCVHDDMDKPGPLAQRLEEIHASSL
ncbi:hypothetical protein B0O80DRAFT_463036 [Mortierella sp. GBAus27b]|nr:hypothetical protein B0O80DRAFT_463036 [Mortierella sp. GBAus27b]